MVSMVELGLLGLLLLLFAAITGMMGLFSGSGSWATDGLIETVFSNLSYSEAAAVFGADPFLCLVYVIAGGVLQKKQQRCMHDH